LTKRDLFTDLVIADYFIDKCVIFSKNNLQSDEYNLFTKVYEIISTYLPKPDLLIYLYNTSDNLLKNIAKRGRPYEQDITADYLESIQENYLNYLKNRTQIPILIVESNKLDFVNNPEDYQKLKDLVSKSYPVGITRIIF
jgi:deoxyadenosine/deoxycytidine kinase